MGLRGTVSVITLVLALGRKGKFIYFLRRSSQMAAPDWFRAVDYFNNKLAASEGMTSAELQAAFRANGYDTTADGLYQHYLDYGSAEWISPNALFNSQEYVTYKAKLEFDTTTPSIVQISEIEAALRRDGFTPWEHYRQYGWREGFNAADTFGLNPSGKFNQEDYFKAKLQQLRADDPASDWNITKIKDAFMASGMDPVTHWLEWGYKENLNFKPATAEAGLKFNLTKGDDVFTGGAGDDLFYGDPGTLGDYDKLDGDGGNDALWAIINGDNNVTRPEIKNIEKISFSAQHERDYDTGSNNVTRDGWPVAVDADRIEGMTYLENDRSRADLAVEDVTTWSPMLTVAFKDTDPGDVDWGVFFDPQAIKANDSVADVDLQLMDVVYAQLEKAPLKYLNVTGFNFVHKLVDGTTNKFSLKMRAEDADKYTGEKATYDTLLEAFKNALTDFEEANPDYKGVFEVSKGPDFPGHGELNGIDYQSTGTSIRIHSNKGAISAPTLDMGAVSGAPSSLRLHTEISTLQGCPLYQTNIHLDNVGRVLWGDARPECLPSHDDYGSEAGDMVVGSMATYGGIERFDVTVDRGSWLSSLSSTNNALRMIKVKNEGEGNKFLQAEEDGPGQLYIGDSQEPDGSNLVNWQDKPHLLATNGLTDVKYFDGSEMKGKINIGAQITEAAYDKYTKDVDGLRTFHDKFAPEGNFKYAFGENHDKLNMVVDGGIAADNDFLLEVNMGAGNDFINFSFDQKITTNEVDEIIKLRSVVLSGDGGNDTIKSWGNGGVKANGGAGDDAIFVGQTLKEHGDNHNTVWVLNTATPAAGTFTRSIYWDDVNGAQPLNNDFVTASNAVSFANATAGTAITVRVTFRDVYSKDITINTPTVATGTLDIRAVNKAIIQAINEDPWMSKFLVAKDGQGHSLLVESLADGANTAANLSLTFTGATVTYGGVAYATGVAGAQELATESDELGAVNYAYHGSAIQPFQYDIVGFHPTTTAGNVYTTTDYLAIKIGNDVYISLAPVAAANDAAVINALNSARTVDGKLFSDRFTAVDIPATDGTVSIVSKAAGYADEVDVHLYAIGNGVTRTATGTDQGTLSNNIVNAGEGNDVIVLNAKAPDAKYYDTIALDGTIGRDVIVNAAFAAAGTSSDKIDVQAYKFTATNKVQIGTSTVAAANDHMFTAKEIGGMGLTADTNATSIYFLKNLGTDDVYTVFTVNNDGFGAIVESEINVIGTMTFDDDANFVTANISNIFIA